VLAGPDEHHLAERQFFADRTDRAEEMVGEEVVHEDDLRLGVGQDELQLPAGESKVERVDDPCPEVRRVVQLEVLVAIRCQDGELVVPPETELAAHRVGEAKHAPAVAGVIGVVVTIV
jgi:hypothetical protein